MGNNNTIQDPSAWRLGTTQQQPQQGPGGVFTIKTHSYPEVWSDGRNNYRMLTEQGTWETLINVPPAASGYLGEAQSNYSWPPMVMTRSKEFFDAVDSLESDARSRDNWDPSAKSSILGYEMGLDYAQGGLPGGFPAPKFTKAGPVREGLKQKLQAVGHTNIEWNDFNKWTPSDKERAFQEIAANDLSSRGIAIGGWEIDRDQQTVNTSRRQMSAEIKSAPQRIASAQDELADQILTLDPTSEEYEDELTGLTNSIRAINGLPPIDQPNSTNQYIAQQLALGTPEGKQAAADAQGFLNRLTPFQISQIQQSQNELAWRKHSDLFDRSMTRQQFDRLLDTDIFNQDIARRQMALSEEQQDDLQTQRGVTNQLERDKFNLSDEQFELTYGLSKQQIDDLRAQRGVTNQLERDKFNLSDQQFQQTYGLSKQQLDDLNKQRGVENQLERDRLTMSDQQFQQTYGLSKNQFMAGEDQRSFENRFAQDQFNAQQEQLQFSNQQALTDQAFRATELGLDLLNSPGDLFTFLTRLRGEQGSLPFQQGGQAIPRTFPFTFNQAIPPQPFGLRDMNWAPPDYDWGPGGYQQPEVPDWIPDTPPSFPEVGDQTIPPPTAPPLPPVAPTASDDAVQQIMRDQAAADDPVTWDVAREIANIEAQTTPTAMATPTSATVAPTSAIAPTLGAGATSPMGGTIAQSGIINPTAQTSPSQQFGFGGTGTRTVTPSGIPMTTLQPFGLPTSTVGPLPEQGLSQAFLGMPPTGRRTLASLGAPPALSYQSMSRLTPTERAIRLSEAKAQGFSEQDFLEEDIRHQMSPRTGGGRARFDPGRFRG